MIPCNPRAFVRCPYHRQCDGAAEYAEGSACDNFNQKILEQPMTNADRIRAMSDEEMAKRITLLAEGETTIHYCRNLPECDVSLERDELIPLERCEQCVLHWLRQPAEEDCNNNDRPADQTKSEA